MNVLATRKRAACGDGQSHSPYHLRHGGDENGLTAITNRNGGYKLGLAGSRYLQETAAGWPSLARKVETVGQSTVHWSR